MPSAPRGPASPASAEFGRRVRAERESQGLSQEMLAERCGLHWTFVSQVERGQRSIRLDNIVRLADGLGVKAGLLMDDLPSA